MFNRSADAIRSSTSILYLLFSLQFLHLCYTLCLDDKYRPQLHYSPSKHWMNDPNGLIYLDGEYHLFYQYNPNATVSGQVYWGHAISTDLVHWTELPIALSPNDIIDVEPVSLFSGCAVLDAKNSSGLQTGSITPMILFFTQATTKKQQQSIAVSNDRGRTFEMYSKNPVIPNDDEKVPDFRDPKIFNWKDKWIMMVAAGDKIQFLESDNLLNWNSISEFGARPLQGSHGGVWECPDLLPFTVNGQRVYVLLVSINPGGPNQGSATQYFVGSFNGKQFLKSVLYQPLWLDWGPDNYAGVSWFNEPNNRSLLIAWMSNWDYGKFLPTSAWRGQMTLPRVLNVQRLDGRLRLQSQPAAEVDSLRISSQFFETTQPLSIRTGHDFTNDLGFRNSLLEVDVLIDTQLMFSDSLAYLRLCLFNDLAEEVCVGYSFGSNEIHLDRSMSGDTSFYSEFAAVATANRESKNRYLQMKVYLDVSSIEVFVDGGFTTMTGLFFPTEAFTRVKVEFNSAKGINQLTLLSATIRGLKSIYDC
ncbi:levanase-like [Bradysia coprophila]|uniref:levanase-like n=1 Tax=Bradysia coprophila TaxID=38358 RepID=UPI00187DB637|nr:levanase-like [Bradysia coprophila]